MKTKRFIAIILVLLLGLFGCSSNNEGGSNNVETATPIDYNIKVGSLSEDGVTNYIIVIPSRCGDAIKYGAEEIKNYLKQSSNANISVKTDSEVSLSNGQVISLGKTSHYYDKGIINDFSTSKNDSFYIKSIDSGFYIDGKTDRGTLYGAYEFIERFIGVRWFSYDYTYVPQNSTIDLYKTNMYENPAFDIRCYLSNPLMNNVTFSSHCRMNNEFLYMDEKYGGDVGIFRDGIDAVHNTLDYIPTTYYNEHPEWFFVHENNRGVKTIYDICFSRVGLTENGEIDDALEVSPVKIAVERLKSFILKSNSTYYMIGQEDHVETCSCSECKIQEQKYKRSGMLLRFVNAIAREINEWLPSQNIDREIKIVTFAYYYSQTAPLNNDGEIIRSNCGIEPEPNVYVRLAPITAYNYYSLQDEKQDAVVRTMFSEWSKITDRLFIWNYNTAYNGYFVYYPVMQHWNEDLQLFAQKDTAYVLMQSAYNEINTWQNIMETYIASKLLWNPKASITKLKEEFITHYYQGFDDLITEFMDNLDIKYALNFAGIGIPKNKIPLSAIGDMDTLLDPELYSVSFWERELELLALADERIDNMNISQSEKSTLKNRVAVIRLTPQYMVAMNYSNYYPGDEFGRSDFLKEFFTNCQKLGVVLYSESGSIDGLKTLLQYNG